MRKFIHLFACGVFCAGTFLNGSTVKAESSEELKAIVVTATREEKPKAEVPESIEVMTGEEIRNVSPSHPSEVLNRIPGVHINNLGGEGHMSSIRQPITTAGVYLFLEDGVPTRPTGFFNHNGLYEINIPLADRLEVIKGPGSALYGSDAIGGVINSMTKPSPSKREVEGSLEYGSYGWKRLLLTGGSPIKGDTGIRVDLNVSDNDGYQDQSGYSRVSTTGRLDSVIGDDIAVKGIVSFTTVDQSGASGLEAADYRNHPKKNRYHGDIGFRDVYALRVSSEFAYEPDDVNLLTFTPFFRDNSMELMPSWMVTYDPNIYKTEFRSFGMLAKYRRRFPSFGGELVAGIDVDHTPSTYTEKQITVTQVGDIYVDHSFTGRTNYNYDADQTSVSPYLHLEWKALPRLRLTGGLRYDYFHLDYKDKLDPSVPETVGFKKWWRPDSQAVSYDHFSPKAGLIVNLTESHNAYANYRHAFRVPSAGQLFRSGSTTNTADLEPVKSDSFEVGFRGRFFKVVNYDLALYHMTVKDDIVRFIDGADRKVANAGETTHKGVEIGVNIDLTEEVGFHSAWTFTKQEYKDFEAVVGFPAKVINFGGFDVARAPKSLGNMSIEYRPRFLAGSRVEFEWEHLGEYFTDETNTAKYGGHDLFNIRASYDLTDRVEFFGRALNITDKLYSSRASNQVGDPDIEYRIGLPVTFFIGVRAKY